MVVDGVGVRPLDSKTCNFEFVIKLLWPPKRSSEPLGERDRVGGPHVAARCVSPWWFECDRGRLLAHFSFQAAICFRVARVVILEYFM